ncbi:MAG: IclR family transcriptional regulator [Myxococcota bacterium]|nr:IclR family transcriptional regulator [Myxococcota bacterium]
MSATPDATSIDRALALLFVLHESREALGVTQVARAAGMPKSSAHRLLAALSRRGLVEQDESGRYAPGFALVALGLGAQGRDAIARVTRPALFELAEGLGETVFLCAPRGGHLVVVDKVEGAGFLRAAPDVGTRIPTHATAVGQLFLALRPEAVPLGSEPFESFGPATPRSRAELEPRLSAIRVARRAESRGGWIPGLWVMAAPIHQASEMCGAVAVAAPEARVAALSPLRVADALGAAVARIDARLAGKDTQDPARPVTPAGDRVRGG